MTLHLLLIHSWHLNENSNLCSLVQQGHWSDQPTRLLVGSILRSNVSSQAKLQCTRASDTHTTAILCGWTESLWSLCCRAQPHSPRTIRGAAPLLPCSSITMPRLHGGYRALFMRYDADIAWGRPCQPCTMTCRHGWRKQDAPCSARVRGDALSTGWAEGALPFMQHNSKPCWD